jgi:hypothetical protein
MWRSPSGHGSWMPGAARLKTLTDQPVCQSSFAPAGAVAFSRIGDPTPARFTMPRSIRCFETLPGATERSGAD